MTDVTASHTSVSKASAFWSGASQALAGGEVAAAAPLLLHALEGGLGDDRGDRDRDDLTAAGLYSFLPA
jgi:hypothetical protein